METSAFAKAPAFLMRRGLAALISHAPCLCEIALLYKIDAILKSGRSMLRPYGIKKDPSFCWDDNAVVPTITAIAPIIFHT